MTESEILHQALEEIHELCVYHPGDGQNQLIREICAEAFAAILRERAPFGRGPNDPVR